MRMYMMNITLLTHLFQHDLDSTGQKAFMRIPDRDEQCRVFVCPGVQVFLQMQFGSCIEVNNPFSVALAENDASLLNG